MGARRESVIDLLVLGLMMRILKGDIVGRLDRMSKDRGM